MTNGFFNHDNPEARRTIARAESVNATFQAIADGFDKLPTEDQQKQGRVTYGTAGGAANAYTVALPYGPTTYVEGLHVALKVPATNTGASTLNVNGLGVKSIKRIAGDDPIAGDLFVGAITEFRYDGSAFRIVATQYGDVLLAKDWAQKTGATVDGAGYSAKEHAEGTVVPTGSSKQWAETTGGLIGGSGYSAKEHAVGSTVPTGSAKDWATYVTGLVGGTDYSAKEYAIGTQAGTGGSAKNWAQQSGGVTGAAVGGFSARDWAVKAGATVDGTYFSARQYSLNAATSAGAAAASETNAATSATAAAAAVANTNSVWCGTAGGTANTVTLTPSPALGAYVAGITIRFKASAANTGAMTVNVSALGVKNLKNADGTALALNSITSGMVVEATYDGSEFRQSGGGSVSTAQIHASLFLY